MKNRILLLIVIILSGVLIFVSSKYHTTFFMLDNVNKNIVIKDKDNLISEVELEEYVVGVVAAEMPASFDIEALKAQAVASRSYAVYKMNNSKGDYDVVTDVSNQSYITVVEMKKKWGDDFSKYYTKVQEAVNSTKGEVLTYNDEVIEAFYFAMSNGYTEEASLVFSEDKDYLHSVASIYDNSDLKNFEVTTTFTKDDFCAKLNIKCDTIVIQNIKRSDTHRVNEITINGETFKGTTIRKLLNLRSTDFEIAVKQNIAITTKGYGHGVGMSQYGANGMAKSGQNYKQILTYYYQNVKISSI